MIPKKTSLTSSALDDDTKMNEYEYEWNRTDPWNNAPNQNTYYNNNLQNSFHSSKKNVETNKYNHHNQSNDNNNNNNGNNQNNGNSGNNSNNTNNSNNGNNNTNNNNKNELKSTNSTMVEKKTDFEEYTVVCSFIKHCNWALDESSVNIVTEKYRQFEKEFELHFNNVDKYAGGYGYYSYQKHSTYGVREYTNGLSSPFGRRDLLEDEMYNSNFSNFKPNKKRFIKNKLINEKDKIEMDIINYKRKMLQKLKYSNNKFNYNCNQKNNKSAFSPTSLDNDKVKAFLDNNNNDNDDDDDDDDDNDENEDTVMK